MTSLPLWIALSGGSVGLPSFPAWPQTWSSPALEPAESVVGDADGDGRIEIVSAILDGGRGKLVVHESDGAGDFVETHRTPLAESTLDPLTHVAGLADTDGDLAFELIAVESGADHRIHVWEAVDDDTFVSVGVVASELAPGADPVRLRTADLDQDGRRELVLAHPSAIVVWEHDGAIGTHSFTEVFEHTPEPGFGAIRDFAVGDTDGDGQHEIVLTSVASDSGAPSFRRIEFANGGGATQTDYAFPAECGALLEPAPGDFDGDSVDELAFSLRSDCGAAGDGLGVFVLEATADDVYSIVYVDRSLVTSPRARVDVGPFSCLPIPPIAVAASGDGVTSGGIQLYAWHPDGYAPVLSAPVAVDDALSVSLRDMDADRRPELITAVPDALRVFEQHTWCYGSGGNPIESLLILGGEPTQGTTLTMGVDDPLGVHVSGSTPIVMLALFPDPNFPAGTYIPGYGLFGATAPGELLVSLTGPLVLFSGDPWIEPATPAPVDIPFNGVSLYAQGVMFGLLVHGGPHAGLTEGMELPLSP